MFKRLMSVIIAITVCVVGLSGCGELPSGETEAMVGTEITTPIDLTKEEMQIWENMPDIVTMRVLNNYETETTEIMYIEKTGVVKSIVCNEYSASGSYEWIIGKINDNEAETAGVVDLHELIDFYDILLLVDLKKEMYIENSLLAYLPMEYDHNYDYFVYGVYKSGKNVRFAEGYTTYNSYINDLYGKTLFLNYLNFDKAIPQYKK